MRKYLLPVLIVTFVSCLAGLALCIIWWKRQPQVENHSNAIPEGNELVFTKEEEKATGKWRNGSMDDLVRDAYSGDPAGLWVVGMCFLTGSMDFPVDVKSANGAFSQSASLGFAPSLDRLKKMYAFDLQNPFLSYVYLNLTVSSGHNELLGIYHKIRSQLIENGGLKIVNEIEKIAIHKKTLILKLAKIKNNPDEFIKLMLSGGTITDEDVLFDMKFWEEVYSGRLATGNLEEWLRDSKNVCLKIERLGQQATGELDRLASYETGDKKPTEEDMR